MNFSGTWHIQSMEMWDEDYCNMETQAYIEIKSISSGSFQFGLVAGQLDGHVTDINGQKIFIFSWDGNDECDLASGCGWCTLQDTNTLIGELMLHLGDYSGFEAVRV